MSWKGLNVLITAGPTREYLDPVRYLTNGSSGSMGFALARAARGLGAKVSVVSGPTELPLLPGIQVTPVVTAGEMLREVLKRSRKTDVFIGAAAVGDWRFARPSAHKLKRKPGPLRLTLLPNPDIIATVSRRRPAYGRGTGWRRPRPLVVGFALETRLPLAHARRKLAAKGLDLVVANGPESLGGSRTKAVVLSKDGSALRLPWLTKAAAARAILRRVARELGR